MKYELPHDFRAVREPQKPHTDPPPPPPLEPGEYLLQIKKVTVFKQPDRPDRVCYISMVMEGPGRGMKFAGREFHDTIQASLAGAPWHLQLFYACFGRRSVKWRMTHYKGQWEPKVLIGRFYRATLSIRESFHVVTDRRSAKDG